MPQQFDFKNKKGRQTAQKNGPAFVGKINTNVNLDKVRKVCKERLPTKRLKPNTAIISQAHHQILNESSVVLTAEEQLIQLEKEKAAHLILERESAERKRIMKEYDDAKRVAPDPNRKTETEEEQAKILDHAARQRIEQEEEIKLANQIILNAKCSAIRSAQILEKQQLARELREDELRLEKIMEDNRIKAVMADNEQVDTLKLVKRKQAEDIQNQLAERQRQRENEARELEQEAKALANAIEAYKRDEEIEAIKKQERANKLRYDQQKMVELSTHNKQLLFEQDKQADIKVIEYRKERDLREDKFRLEKKLAKKEAERKQETIALIFSKTAGIRNDQIEMTLRREYEEKEREYRKREMEAAIRRKQIEKEMSDVRRQQMVDMRDRKVQEILRDKKDFDFNCERLKKEKEREHELSIQRSKNQAAYRAEIIRQMNDIEYKRRAIIEENKNDLVKYKKEENERQKLINNAIQDKIQSLRNIRMPDEIIHDVQRKLKNF